MGQAGHRQSGNANVESNYPGPGRGENSSAATGLPPSNLITLLLRRFQTLHLLRRQLGEEEFWNGLRAYTQAHIGRTVESRDFQTAIQQASGQSLAVLFDQWVFETPAITR